MPELTVTLNVALDALRVQRALVDELVDHDRRFVLPAERDSRLAQLGVLLDGLIAAAEAQHCKPIRKTWMYDGEPGEIMLDLDEFAREHIQDYPVGLEVARKLLLFGQDTNDDERAGVHECYTLINRPELIRQLREVHPDDLQMAGIDGPMLDEPDTHPVG